MDKKETYSQEVVRMYADEYVPAVHRIGRFIRGCYDCGGGL